MPFPFRSQNNHCLLFCDYILVICAQFGRSLNDSTPKLRVALVSIYIEKQLCFPHFTLEWCTIIFKRRGTLLFQRFAILDTQFAEWKLYLRFVTQNFYFYCILRVRFLQFIALDITFIECPLWFHTQSAELEQFLFPKHA